MTSYSMRLTAAGSSSGRGDSLARNKQCNGVIGNQMIRTQRQRQSSGGTTRNFSSETFPRKLPPCCANLSRSTSAYDNFGEEARNTMRSRHEDEGGGHRDDDDDDYRGERRGCNEPRGDDDDDDDFGINSCKIHSGNPSPNKSHLSRGAQKGLATGTDGEGGNRSSSLSSLVRQRRVSNESGGSGSCSSGNRKNRNLLLQQNNVEVQVPEGGRSSLSSNDKKEDGNKPSSSLRSDGAVDKKGSLGFKGRQLISGRWEALLDLAIPTPTYFPEKDFLFAFLLCSRLHSPPYQTLSSVFTHFSTPSRQPSNKGSGGDDEEEDDDEGGTTSSRRTQEQESSSNEQAKEADDADAVGIPEEEEESRISWGSSSSSSSCNKNEQGEMSLNEDEFPLLIKFIGFWAERLPHDFRDDRMMQFIRIISRTVSSNANISAQVREEVSSILAHLSDKLSALESYDGTLLRLRTEALIGEPIAAPSVVTICPNVERMAEQLTLVELERFSYIGSQELVAQLVRKDRVRQLQGTRRVGESCETFYYGMETTTYLDAFIAWFKRLSMFVASEICKMSEKKSRVRVIEYWIKVAKECFKIRNFNSLMAILTGLIGSPVARLKKTWHKICCAELVELQTAMDPQSNFSAYRIMYKTAISSTSCVPHKESHNYKIIVPYFALLLRDLYNVNSTYPSSLPNGHINLAKYKELAELTKEIISWKFVRCQFVKIQHVFNSVQALPIFSEDELMCASYQCEDPHSFEEKEHYVKLRRGK